MKLPDHHNSLPGRFRHPVFPHRLAMSVLAGLAALPSVVPAFAGDSPQDSSQPSSGDWVKPLWLTDLSLGIQESHDSNVYLLGMDVGTPVPGYNNALANKASWITTFSPKIGVDLAKLFADGGLLKTFALGYAPDFVIFHDATDETYSAQRVTTNIKAGTDSALFSLANTFTYINGSDDSVLYPGNPKQSAFASMAVRERLGQWQDRTQASIKLDAGPDVFIRPAFSLLYYHLGVDFSSTSGYVNFVDRYDVNGGLDFGYNLTKKLALTLGYRYGYQYQAALPSTVTTLTPVNNVGRDATNDYQRFFLGAEGSPVTWLKLQASVGPEFVTYTGARPYLYGVVANGQIPDAQTDLYGEVLATIALSSADELVFKWKRWDWVSSLGANTCRESAYSGTYRHQFSDSLSVEAALISQEQDYRPGTPRNDWQFTASVGAKYAVNKNLALSLSYSYIRGLNNENLLTTTQTDERQYVDNLIAFGAVWKY